MGDRQGGDRRDIGGYRVRSRLGWGGMGEVYLAAATGLEGVERPVAIKMIRDLHRQRGELIEMFVEEAKVSFLLVHPNIVQTYEIGQLDGHYFLVMEYVDGITVEQLLRHVHDRLGQPLPVPFALYIGARTARALDHAHSLTDQQGKALGIVHRDISPGNILLSRDGQVKLADFGLAKSALRRVESDAGLIKGKLAYMAPEQLAGQEVGPPADIFALGVVLYEMLAGENPFGAAGDISVASRSGRVAPPLTRRAPHLPSDVVQVVERCMAGDPGERHAGARDLGRALDDCLRQSGHAVSDYDLAEFIERARHEAERAARPEPHPFDLALGVELEKVAGGAAGVSTFARSVASADAPSPATTLPPRRPAPRRWVLLSGALLLAVGVALAVHGLARRERVEPRPARPPVATIGGESPDGAAPGSDRGTGTGTLHVRPRPAGGAVRVAGKLRGTAPVSIAGLPAGRPLRVQIELEGHRPYDQQVTLDPGGTLALEPRLARSRRRRVRQAPQKGLLSVNSEPWSVVHVNGAKVRSTPLVRHPLPVGTHRVRLYNPVRKLTAVRTVRIRAGQVTRLSVELGK